MQAATTSLSDLIRSGEAESRTGNEDSAKLVQLDDVIFRDVRPVMLMLLGCASLLLLIASINVVNLLLTRSGARHREIAIQRALGVSSERLLSRFGAEAFVLVAASGACGLMLTTVVTRFLRGLLSADILSRMPYLIEVGVNRRLGVFTGAISFIALIVFTVTPLARVGVIPSVSALKEGSRGSAGVTWRRFGRSLVIAELAIAIVLLVCAGLFGKSAYHLIHADTGFVAEDLLALSVGSSGSASDEPPGNLARQVAERLAGVPGVQSVAYADLLPLARGLAPSSGFQVEGAPLDKRVEDYPVRRISAGYFMTLQARLLRGRRLVRTVYLYISSLSAKPQCWWLSARSPDW